MYDGVSPTGLFLVTKKKKSLDEARGEAIIIVLESIYIYII